MFEEYLQDSYEFFDIANTAKKCSDDKKAKRYYRASVFYAAGAIEAFVNYLADSFAQANKLGPVEIAFLNDKTLTFDKGKPKEKTEFHRLDEKLRLILNRFVSDFDYNSQVWSRLMAFKLLRDSLVHPRQNEDETKTTQYHQQVADGLASVIEIMNHLCLGIFKKPLRRQLLDLIPEK